MRKQEIFNIINSYVNGQVKYLSETASEMEVKGKNADVIRAYRWASSNLKSIWDGTYVSKQTKKQVTPEDFLILAQKAMSENDSKVLKSLPGIGDSISSKIYERMVRELSQYTENGVNIWQMYLNSVNTEGKLNSADPATAGSFNGLDNASFIEYLKTTTGNFPFPSNLSFASLVKEIALRTEEFVDKDVTFKMVAGRVLVSCQ